MNLKLLLSSIIIAVFLLIFAGVASIYYIIQSDISVSVLTYDYPKEVILDRSYNEMYKGEKLRGEFTSKDNYLGILLIEVETFDRFNDDIVRFRIKEKGTEKWMHQEDHDSERFSGMELYPFGFPLIDNAKGKIYYFEVESLQGEPENAVALHINTTVLTKHQYPRAQIAASAESAFEFFIKKTISALFHFDLLFIVAASLLPFILFVYRKWFIKLFLDRLPTQAILQIDTVFIPKLKKSKRYAFTLSVLQKIKYMLRFPLYIYLYLFIVFTILVVPFYHDIMAFILAGLWIYLTFKYSIRQEVHFIAAAILLLSCPVLYFIDPERAIKAATWFYIFSIIGAYFYISGYLRESK